MESIIIAVVLFGLSGLSGFFYSKQKKKVTLTAGLKDLDPTTAKSGDLGLFRGKVEGTPVKVPYYQDPVAYYNYSLSEQEVTIKDGKRQKRWKLIKKGKSQVPFKITNGQTSVMIDPTEIVMQKIELYNGKAVGFNKDVFEAIQFITEGAARPDLMTKTLKLMLEGLPIGQEVTIAGKLADEGGQLILTKDQGLGNLYTTQDMDDIVKKEKMMVWVFLGVAVVIFGIGVWALINGLTA
ncbi:MAG: GIDE domain-containing protein [Patescibacteria group bacterium]